VKIQAYAHSDPGRRRSRNEDRVYCDERERVFVVVDGMGGQAAGEKAAEVAMAAIKRRLQEKTGEVERRIREAIWHANEEILRLAATRDEWKGMGCVVTLAVIEDGEVFVGHVGDSRLYEIRDGSIWKITHDHSPVGIREDAGEIGEQEAMRHPRRNEVYRDVGSARHELYDDSFIEFVRRPFYPDGALVLCSDGLSDMVTADEIRACVEKAGSAGGNPASDLVKLANERGGKDNVTVIVVTGEDFSARNRLRPNGQDRDEATGAKTGRRRALLSPTLFLLAGVALGIALLTLALAFWPRAPWGPGGVDRATSLPSPASADFAVMNVGKGRPFETIQQAMQQAQAGDAIEVDPGIYEGPIELKNGVRMVAREPGTAIIEAEDVLPNQSAAVRGQSLQSTVLEGFVIRAKKGRKLAMGIRLISCKAAVYDMEVTGTYLVGIWNEGDSQCSLVGNRLHDNSGRGLVVEGRSRVTLNQIEKNTVGIEIGPESGALNISSNLVRDNKAGFLVPTLEWKAKVEQQNLLIRNKAEIRGSEGVTPAGRRASE